MSLIFEDVEKSLPLGIKEEFQFTLFTDKRKLEAILKNLNKELSKRNNSNLRNSKDWIVSILENYHYINIK
tara:strand:- start:1458 stop:1670 length:213 start_codon:yes stop_codon:yes gene_type:complete